MCSRELWLLLVATCGMKVGTVVLLVAVGVKEAGGAGVAKVSGRLSITGFSPVTYIF